jgi:transposase
VIDSLHTCPSPELARLGRTLGAWCTQLLAYFETGRVSNGGTEAINLLIEKAWRLVHRTFEHYRLRILLAPQEPVPTAEAQPMLDSEEPVRSTLTRPT